MILLFSFILLMLGILFLSFKRDVLYPAVTVNFVFVVVLIGYACSSNLYIYPLHAGTLIFVLSSLVLFSLSCWLADSLLVRYGYKDNYSNINCPLNGSSKRLALIVLLLSFFYIIMRLKGYAIGTNLIVYLNEIRKTDIKEHSRNLTSYLQPFILVAFAMYALSNNISKNKISRTANSFIVLIFLLAILLNTGKQIVFMAIISYCFIVGIRKTRHYLYLMLSTCAIFILYMFLLRGLTGNITYYISMYLVSPLIAFQQFYFENNSDYAVSHAFWFFERIREVISGGEPMSLHKEFVWVGLPTNVFTAFSDYISISPFFNYIMMIIHGALSGLLWRLSKTNNHIKIFYSYFIYTFMFMFYHESFMVNISSWIQVIIAIFIINGLLKLRIRA